ncbi:MAG: hypothetical protein GY778_04095 [bacterium]|nr:hypothetical protein [bacterium]
MYAKLLARAYQTIKEVDPTAQVLGCSTAGIDTAFIKMVLKHQAPFDALTVHPYRHALDPAGFMRELRETRDLVGGREVWITEMGWPSNIGGLTERQQAGYVARTYISALASGAARSVAWYDFREDGTDPYYNEHHFGLVRNDLTPKIGYRALAAVGQRLGRSQFKGELSLGDDLVGFVFEDGDRQTAALWSPEVTRLVRFEIEPADAVVLNVINEPAAAARSGSSVALRLMADLPVYVRSDGPLTIKRRPAPAVIETDRPGVHPGEAFTIRVRAEADVKSGRPVPPAGWTVSGSETDQALTVTPPTWALPGDYTVSVPIEYAGQTIDLPVAVRIVPALVRG